MPLPRPLVPVLFLFFAFGPPSVLGQTQPNLENGFKPYGSYDGTHLDTVNLMNGNLQVHIPLPPSYPQRGGRIGRVFQFQSAAKGWTVITTGSAPNFGLAWAPLQRSLTSLSPSLGSPSLVSSPA